VNNSRKGETPFGHSEPYKLAAERPTTFLRRAGSDRDKRRTKAFTLNVKYMNDFILKMGGGSCAKYMITVGIVLKSINNECPFFSLFPPSSFSM
jgi:hypothetical protein